MLTREDVISLLVLVAAMVLVVVVVTDCFAWVEKRKCEQYGQALNQKAKYYRFAVCELRRLDGSQYVVDLNTSRIIQ